MKSLYLILIASFFVGLVSCEPSFVIKEENGYSLIAVQDVCALGDEEAVESSYFGVVIEGTQDTRKWSSDLENRRERKRETVLMTLSGLANLLDGKNSSIEYAEAVVGGAITDGPKKDDPQSVLQIYLVTAKSVNATLINGVGCEANCVLDLELGASCQPLIIGLETATTSCSSSTASTTPSTSTSADPSTSMEPPSAFASSSSTSTSSLSPFNSETTDTSTSQASSTLITSASPAWVASASPTLATPIPTVTVTVTEVC